MFVPVAKWWALPVFECVERVTAQSFTLDEIEIEMQVEPENEFIFHVPVSASTFCPRRCHYPALKVSEGELSTWIPVDCGVEW